MRGYGGHGGTSVDGGHGRAIRRLLPALLGAVLAAQAALVAPVAGLLPASTALAAATFSDPFFREQTIWSGLTKPTSVRFAADGRAFVAEKAGIIKEFDSISDTTPTVVADLSADTMNYWDRGLLGIAIDPDFLAGRPYLYVFYVWGGLPPRGPGFPGEDPQRWGDSCPAVPTGPGGTTDGCPASTKIDRLTIDLSTNVMTGRQNLIWDACQQFPSHSGGGMAFGPDKQLYITTGEGASFNVADYGQRGGTIPDPSTAFVPVNPCADPVTVTSAAGATPTVDVKTAQGGALRSQDVRTTGDPTGLDGSLLRINPDTGAASSGNPLAASSDPNARRIVAMGFRNPFRLTFRPGTSDIYVAHVGNTDWEAINRIAVPTTARTPTTLPNAGWPCYEGPAIAKSFQSLGTDMCASLYAAGAAAWTPPFYSYSHSVTNLPTGPCFNPDPANGKDGGSPTGLAFYQGPGAGTAAYPSKYTGGLFFVDYDRDCLAVLPAGSGGIPDPSKMEQVASSLANPVDLLTGPGGDLYYVDHDGGRVVRIRYLIAPVARATATPTAALAPVTVHLDASTSTDPDPSSSLVAWRWDLNGDGLYDDATGATFDWKVSTPAVYQVGLEVESSNGLTDTTSLTVDLTDAPPVPVIDTPADTLTWAVGDTIAFSGHATDQEDGTIPASGLQWDVVMQHCPADCHQHLVESFTGASGSFQAPDHPYPSHLELRLTATDSHGTAVTTTIELQPRTKTISVDSTPQGVPVSVGTDTLTTPTVSTVIEGSTVGVSAPLTTTSAGSSYRFWAWADSDSRARDVLVATDVSLSATYLPDAADACASATPGTAGAWIPDRAGGNGDVDWYRFSLTAARRVVVTLGDLPVDGRIDLYSACSTRIAGADSAGTRFEELTRTLGAGTYRVKVSFPGDGRSQTPYVVRFRPLPSGMKIKSSLQTAGAGGGAVRIVGEVINNTGSTKGRPRITATFRNASGTVVGTLAAFGYSRRLGDGAVTPFLIVGTVPAYASMSWAITNEAVAASRALTLTALTKTAQSDGTVRETGKVKNTGTTTARGAGVSRTWYGPRGEVLDRGTATLSPSTLSPGQTGSFTIIRPVLTNAQASLTGFRAS